MKFKYSRAFSGLEPTLAAGRSGLYRVGRQRRLRLRAAVGCSAVRRLRGDQRAWRRQHPRDLARRQRERQQREW